MESLGLHTGSRIGILGWVFPYEKLHLKVSKNKSKNLIFPRARAIIIAIKWRRQAQSEYN